MDGLRGILFIGPVVRSARSGEKWKGCGGGSGRRAGAAGGSRPRRQKGATVGRHRQSVFAIRQSDDTVRMMRLPRRTAGVALTISSSGLTRSSS